jgi:sugar/nucleoside kinase (ribokinase family)
MDPQFLVFGQLTREYLLPPLGSARLDAPGGSLLYAASGLKVWESEVGLVVRVGNDYPHEWLNDFKARGFDTSGVHILSQSMDVREFFAYNESFEANHINPVSHFARREMTFPKSLLGYQPPDEKRADRAGVLSVNDIPNDYLDARAAHLCPMDLVTQTQLIAGLKRGTVSTFTLDPAPATMTMAARRELPVLLNGVTAFLPSYDELRNLFWGAKHDIWQMAEAVSLYGCEYVVIKCGVRGQLLYDSNTKRRWEIPAYPARVADPTGAGHAFCGGFLAGYCRNYDPLEGALYGNVSASLKLEGNGAFYALDVLPGLAEARLNALKDMVREI